MPGILSNSIIFVFFAGRGRFWKGLLKAFLGPSLKILKGGEALPLPPHAPSGVRAFGVNAFSNPKARSGTPRKGKRARWELEAFKIISM